MLELDSERVLVAFLESAKHFQIQTILHWNMPHFESVLNLTQIQNIKCFKFKNNSKMLKTWKKQDVLNLKQF